MSEVLVESFIKESCKCAWDLHQLFFPTIRFVRENANVKKCTGNNEFHLCIKKVIYTVNIPFQICSLVALVGKATRWHHLHQ